MATHEIYNRFAKWFSNKQDWVKFNWWQTSFNMPIPNLFQSMWVYTTTEWYLNSIWEATTFNLSWFDPGWEILAVNSVFTMTWPFAWWIVNLKQTWRNTFGNVMFTNGPYTSLFPSLSSWYWSFTQLLSNQWIAAWEVDRSWTYSLTLDITWAYTASQTSYVDFTNVPSLPTYTPWMIWVEWNKLCWTSANWHMHKMTWILTASPWATPGALWIEWDYLYWIWSWWWKIRWQYNIRQRSSSFWNGPSPWVVSWQTPWMIWMDSNFWSEHIWYISANGYKWINNSWLDPYA